MWRQVSRVLGPTRLNVWTAAFVGGLLAAVHLALPRAGLDDAVVATATYAAYLVVFSVWMGWFVLTGVRVWRAFGPE